MADGTVIVIKDEQKKDKYLKKIYKNRKDIS